MPRNAPHDALARAMASDKPAIDWDVIAPARPMMTEPTPPAAPAPADVPGYIVTVADHETGAKATRHALTAAIAAKMLGLPADDVARIEADKWGFFMPFDASASATIVRIGGLTYQAGNPSAGQVAYDTDCCHKPTYHDGAFRPAWEALDRALRDNWDRHPTPRH